MVFFGISIFEPPHRWYGVADATTGKITTKVTIPLPEIKMEHDFAITRNYSILNEVPFYGSLIRLLWGTSPFHFGYKDKTRFGIFPRHLKSADQVVWIEAPSMFIYHTAGAWEESGNDGSVLIILIAVTYRASNAFDLFTHPKVPAKDRAFS